MLKLGSVLLYGLQKKAFPSLKRYSGTKARPSCSTGLPDRLLSLLGQVAQRGLRQRQRSLPPPQPALSASSFQKLYPENWRQGERCPETWKEHPERLLGLGNTLLWTIWPSPGRTRLCRVARARQPLWCETAHCAGSASLHPNGCTSIWATHLPG